MLIGVLSLSFTGCISVHEHNRALSQGSTESLVGVHIKAHYEYGDSHSSKTGTVVSTTDEWMVITGDDGKDYWVAVDSIFSIYITD